MKPRNSSLFGGRMIAKCPGFFANEIKQHFTEKARFEARLR